MLSSSVGAHFVFFHLKKNLPHPLRSPGEAQPTPGATGNAGNLQGLFLSLKGKDSTEEFSRSCSPSEPPYHRRKRLQTPLPLVAAPVAHQHSRLPAPLPTNPPTTEDPSLLFFFFLVCISQASGAASEPLSAGAWAVGGEGKSRKREQAGEHDIWKV